MHSNRGRLERGEEIFIPSIVVYELEVGIAKSNNPAKRKEQLNLLLEQIEIVDFSKKEAKEAAAIRANLEKIGTLLDQWIL